ncbi:MAG TPA: DNA-3-methyladenine glycosylase 2 family protein [Firmicutes bacterium]|nr:DNA-3-methyladenine glycosylase 2 family protein [Candidatus Fermentithermobacillaceae bacterium]
MATFKYGQTEIEYLSRRDRLLGQAIARIGMIEREVNPDLFSALIRNIVAQQIAKKAAATVWNRMCELLGRITPARIAAADIDAIQQCGMSMRKAGYIKSAADALVCARLDLEAFPHMSDEEIIKELSSLPGVRVWTAEMLLIFSLGRPNVLSWGDLALKRGMKNLYGLKELSKDQFEECKRRYSPYGSVASLYLWELA